VAPWGRFCDSAVDPSGTIHVVYTNCWWHGLCDEDDPSAPHIGYATRIGGVWTTGLLYNGEAFGIPSIDLDSQQRPHIAFQYEAWHNFRYAYHDGAGWVIEDIVPAEPTRVKKEISLALDANDVPHVAFYQSETVRYGNRIGGTWSDEYVTGSSLEEYRSLTPLVIDPAGSPHIATKGYVTGAYSYRKENGAWITSTIDEDDDAGQMAALAIGPDGTLHMSYERYGVLGGVFYARSSAPGQWTIEQIIEKADHWPGDIAVDSHGRPYVAYNEWTGTWNEPQNVGLTVAWKTSGGWVSLLVDADGENPSLAIDPQDRVHVCYFYPPTNMLRHAELSDYVRVETHTWSSLKSLFRKE
jgi:hypothetical protein